MAEIPKIDFDKGYSYRPTVGVFKDNHLVMRTHYLPLLIGRILLKDLDSIQMDGAIGMNEKDEIVIKVGKNNGIVGLYAQGYQPKQVMELLYQAIVVVCRSQGVDPAWQLMNLGVGTEMNKDSDNDE